MPRAMQQWWDKLVECWINTTDEDIGGHFRKRETFVRCSMAFIEGSSVFACSKQEWEVSFMNVCIAVVEQGQ